MSALQLNATGVKNDQLQQWGKAILFTVLILGAMFLLASHGFAADGEEFAESSAKFEGWVKGNLGKLAGFVALGVGAVVAAVRKDWSWFFGAVILSMGIGIIAGIVNASFTAVI